MSPTELEQLVLATLEDYKAIDVVSIDVRELTTITDSMVVCTGTSKRHLKTMAEQLVKKAKQKGVPPLGVEGEQDAEWILVDLSDVVVHIMLPATREFYSLEKLWTTAEQVREGTAEL